MKVYGFILVLYLSSYFSVCADKEAKVVCAVGAKCVLPCRFQAGASTSIHWKKSPGDVRVHSYFNNKTQLKLQHQNYTDRAFVFRHQDISKGIASLLLKKVKVQDEGRYVCFTSTTTDSKISSVNLKVYVRSYEVDVVALDSELVCRSEGLYPKPAVTWNTGLPLTESEITITVRQREDQLYDIYSSMSPPPAFTVHSCNVSTAHYWRSTEITEEYPIGVFYRDVVLRCPVCHASTESLIWKFNHTERIVSRTGSELVFNESWRPFVDALTDSNSLVLKNLTPDQEGHYSCHISTARRNFVAVMFLKIQLVQLFDQIYEDAAAELELITTLMISTLFILFGVSFCCFKKK